MSDELMPCPKCGGTGLSKNRTFGYPLLCPVCNGRNKISGAELLKNEEALREKIKELHKQCKAEQRTASMAEHRLDSALVDAKNMALQIEALRAERDAALAEAARLQAQVGQMFPFVEAFVENCYAEWDGHEYECPFCRAGHREFNRDDKFLDAVQEHAEGCTWREAAFWLAAHAPQRKEPRP